MLAHTPDGFAEGVRLGVDGFTEGVMLGVGVGPLNIDKTDTDKCEQCTKTANKTS